MENTVLKIVLADDDESDRLLFSEAFGELKAKTRIHTVNNGTQLMEYLVKNVADLPDLVFLDLNMPRKNGLECLKEIKSNKKYQDISIAIYSTSASKTDIDETFSNGANVYIKKPSDFGILKQLLTKVVTAAYLYQDPTFSKEKFLLNI